MFYKPDHHPSDKSYGPLASPTQLCNLIDEHREIALKSIFEKNVSNNQWALQRNAQMLFLADYLYEKLIKTIVTALSDSFASCSNIFATIIL